MSESDSAEMGNQAKKSNFRQKLVKKTDYMYEIEQDKSIEMRVPAHFYGNSKIIGGLDDGVFLQSVNVSKLPGICEFSYTMPDAHWGYGFPIGGVAAFDIENDGVISVGGVGFDINCGMRLITTNLTTADVTPRIKELINRLYTLIPSGVGKKGSVSLAMNQFREVAESGAEWCVNNGYGWEEDLERHESNGKIAGADFEAVSGKAKSRGIDQLGTLGSGNHYLEIQKVGKIFDTEKAAKMGIKNPDQIVVMVHSGSRGFGHQIATDYLKTFLDNMESKWKIPIYEKELAAAPFNSKEGQDYFKAAACAANMSFANRQVMMHHIRKGFGEVFKRTPEELEMHLVYDVAHNIAKIEEYTVDGRRRKVLVHRKGATRSFGPNSPDIPSIYRSIGQPVILGGSMESGSFLLVGTQKAMDETFGTTAHGSGRMMSRNQAKRQIRGEVLIKQMENNGIYVRTASMAGLAEEAGFAYKNISDVVDSIHGAGLSLKVAQMLPIGNIKG